MSTPKPGTYFKKKSDEKIYKFVDTVVEGDAVVARMHGLRGGVMKVPLDQLLEFYDPETLCYEYQVPGTPHTLLLGDVYTRFRTGETYTITQIDPPPNNRVIVRGEKGQVHGICPIKELFDEYKKG